MNTEDIVKFLRNEIGSATIAAGERLVEAQLCNRFGVGRGKVREALRQLEHELYVKITPNVGAEVRAISQKDIEQIYDLMGVLEGLSVRVGTPALSEADIAKIQSLILKMESSDAPEVFFQLNVEFHTFLTYLSGNPYIKSFLHILRPQAYRMAFRGMDNPVQIKACIGEHKKIVDAIIARNPQKAEKLVRDHFLKAKKRLIQYINKSL